MEVVELLQKAIDFIEENLKAEITADDLAKLTGFSTYHFYHVFGDYVGMPVFAYITKRRLKHAIYEAKCSRSLIDTALEYGFNTHAGFFKAFKRQYGCSPKKYLKLGLVEEPVSVNLREEAKFMMTQTQIRQIIVNWDMNLKSEIGAVYDAGGVVKSDSTWYIGEKHVLKTGRNISGLRIHIAVSKALDAQGMIAACPIKTKDNEDFLVIDDRYYVLFNRIEGSFLTTEERYNDKRVKIGEKYGRAIGQLHRVLEKIEVDMELNDNNLYNTVVDWALPSTRSLMKQWGCPLPEEFFEDFVKNFEKLYPKLPRQIIHRDPNPSNIIFSNAEVNGFVDFEIGEINVRLFDPCYCATGILSEAQNVDNGYEKWPELLAGIIQGYDSICSLTEDERQAVPYVIYSIQMIFIAWLEGKEELKNLALTNRKMLLWLWENRDKLF